MTSFTFTSEDLEKVNKNKKPNDKVFAQLENVRVAPGLMEKDKVTINWTQVEEDFLRDATRGTPTILKKGEDLKVILGTNNLDTQKKKESEVKNNMLSLIGQGLSEEQVKDFKFMTNQANIGSVAGDVLMYTATKAPAIFPNIQNVGGAVVQLDIIKIMPDNQERLTYRTATRVTFDKGRTECNYSPYGMSSSYEIPSKDTMIIVLQVDLGPLGDKDYKPLLTCSIHAEGRDAEKVLANIKQDIPTNVTQKTKNSESIKAEYEEIVVKTLKLTGQEEVFYRNAKGHIGEILSGKKIEDAKLVAIKEFNSTPKLFIDVLVDRIVEIQDIKDPKTRADAMKNLQDNSQAFFNHNEKTAGLVEKLSGSIEVSNKDSINQIKSSFTSLVKDTLDDLHKKSNIATLLNPKPDMLYSIDVEALRQHKSTPKLFAEVLVDRISKVNNTKDPTKRAQKIKQLSDNAAKFVDQPKGYMKILVNDTVKEMAKEQNINLPKEGIISKISRNIGLMLAKINVKIHGKSSELKEQKQLIHAARTRDKQGMVR